MSLKATEPRGATYRHILDPKSNLVSVADVSFGPAEIVMPHELPPQTVPMPVNWFQYLSGAPSIMTIYENHNPYQRKF